MKESDDNVVVKKSFEFALRVVKLHKLLTQQRHESVMAKQLLRSGTSIGANIKEAIRAQSRADFKAKLCISLKECSECEYWLELLYASDYLNESEFNSIIQDCRELIKILVSIINKLNNNKL